MWPWWPGPNSLCPAHGSAAPRAKEVTQIDQCPQYLVVTGVCPSPATSARLGVSTDGRIRLNCGGTSDCVTSSFLGPCLTCAVHQKLLWNVMCWSIGAGKSSAFCEARLLQRNLFCKILKGSVAICNSRIVGRWSGGSWDFNRQISCLCVFATPFYKGKHNLKYDYLVL